LAVCLSERRPAARHRYVLPTNQTRRAAGTRVAVDTKFYKHLGLGYAATVHKAQGTTVDRTYVLATPHFDRHTSYVALSRHRENATVFYAGDDFGGRAQGATPESMQTRFVETLSRARPKELAHDYLELEAESHGDMVGSLVRREWDKSRTADNGPSPLEDLDAHQQAAAERWAARQQNLPAPGQGAQPSKTHTQSNSPDLNLNRTRELRRDGPSIVSGRPLSSGRHVEITAGLPPLVANVMRA
jgi:hypothetical protein